MLKIDIATIQDLEIFNQIIAASNNDSDSCQKFPQLDWSTIESTDTCLNFIARNKNQGVGCFVLRIDRGVASLDMICVHPENRNKKNHFGKKMLRHAIKYAKECMKLSRIELLVQKKNAVAIALFEKEGFKKSDTHNVDTGFRMGMNI
jgi:ribosomal protein S18 acetylase RimI-like enzyme